MAHLHDCEIRGIKALRESEEGVKVFLFFVKAWCSFVKHHHDVEEELLESFTDRPGCISANVAQHAMFGLGLHELADYSHATKVRSLIDGFADTLRNHLKSETSASLALQTYKSEGIMKIFKECEAAGFNQPNFGITPLYDLTQDIALPLILGLSESTFENGKYVFSDVPGFARYLVHYWYCRTQQGAWRFLPWDNLMWGMPRSLAFLN
ncbi:uncharacterized protein EAE97_009480 [Botrytis byssoidea]|uniref:Hemerythrin-like domain-containing protein n=1 Tax=Botrytis byssoidea TaxID=139641 RepID=A0A9P5I1V9_9HELO|nr:uncharacterized protein EAE97_009480 [Botrytis byssoidea]KAF7929883.1 hypothetical protein EAE97_009480 [Botrytis byssoidea]